MNVSRNGPVRLSRALPLCGALVFGLTQTSFAQSESQAVKVPHVLPLMQDVKTPWTAPAKAPFTPPAIDNTTQAPVRRKNPALDNAPQITPMAETSKVYTAVVDGSLWAMGTAYKSQFNASTATYIPFFGSTAPDIYPLSLTLSSVSVGGQPVSFDSAVQPVFADLSVQYDRGILTEVYDLATDSVEQSFIFRSLPASGDLVLHIGVQSSLQASLAGDGLLFKNDLGAVTYSHAIAIDARGSKVELSATLNDGGIELRVPASFVATATFPLTVDPVMATFAPDAGTAVTTTPDVAYDVTNNVFCFTWEQVFGTTDHDVYTQMHNAAGTLVVGSTATIDFTTTYWAHPKIANNNIADNFLVVAERGLPTSGTREIVGRTRNAGSTTVGVQFVINGAESGDKSNPDVGGDPVLSGPTYYLVVWQRNFAAGDQDVHGRTVTAASVLNGPGTILIDNSSATNDTNPSVSKSDGIAPFATQSWGVVWQRTFNSADEDIRGATLLWDGSITNASFSVDFSGANDTNPTASSVLDGGTRPWLAAYQRGSGTAHDLQGTVLTGATFVTASNLSLLEGGTFSGEDQVRPSADSDGDTFAVAYSESFLGSGTDYDVYISSFSLSGATLSNIEVHQNLAFSTTHEDFVEITSDHSGGGTNDCYMAAWQDDSGTANIEGGRYCKPTITGTITSACEGNSGCPCNQNGGNPGGCPTSLNPAGALLTGTGNPSVSGDTVVLTASGMPATAPALFFQGTVTIAGGGSVFGDGKRCAGGTVVRLGTKTASGGTASYPSGSPAIHIKGMIPAGGGTFTYQAWFRNSAAFCTPSTFNLTNGLVIFWIP